jgi:uncharacterized membrane protein YbhN (UPF0104 family)
MEATLRRMLGPGLSVVLFSAAVWLLHRELQTYHLNDILASLQAMPTGRIWKALGLTLASYGAMTGYDALALRYIRHPLAYRKIGLASFIGYAFSNNIGLSMIAGASVRYRLYSAWGLSTVEITQMVVFCTLTVWLGFLSLGSLLFLIDPLFVPPSLHLLFTDGAAIRGLAADRRYCLWFRHFPEENTGQNPRLGIHAAILRDVRLAASDGSGRLDSGRRGSLRNDSRGNRFELCRFPGGFHAGPALRHGEPNSRRAGRF